MRLPQLCGQPKAGRLSLREECPHGQDAPTLFQGIQGATGTSWFLGRDTGNLDSHDVWGDGNDIASWTPTQVADAKAFGCAYEWWLVSTGGYPGPSLGQIYRLMVVPADAITVDVR